MECVRPKEIAISKEMQEVLDHWNWYLSCLCNTQQELKVMRMPLEWPLLIDTYR